MLVWYGHCQTDRTKCTSIIHSSAALPRLTCWDTCYHMVCMHTMVLQDTCTVPGRVYDGTDSTRVRTQLPLHSRRCTTKLLRVHHVGLCHALARAACLVLQLDSDPCCTKTHFVAKALWCHNRPRQLWRLDFIVLDFIVQSPWGACANICTAIKSVVTELSPFIGQWFGKSVYGSYLPRY
jgi:hypothetical protein